MRKHTRSKKWMDANTAWRLKALDQISEWLPENGEGSLTGAVRNIVLKRFAKLELFIWSFFPDAPGDPIDPYDAAALIVLPTNEALRLARKLFGGGPGIASDLHAEDLFFNLDWFKPKGFR